LKVNFLESDDLSTVTEPKHKKEIA